MAFLVVDPLQHGTPIYEITGGKSQPIGYSAKWTIRTNDSGKGCPSSIDEIVVAATPGAATAAATAVPLIQKPGVVSSSFTSQDVTEIRVQPDGSLIRRPINYLLVAKSFLPEGETIPIATEIWFSQEPFADQKAVQEAAMKCDEGRPSPQT
jgi:hypothetical protein